MLEIIGTLRENLENVVLARMKDDMMAQDLLQELRITCPEYVRFYVRSSTSVIDCKFYELERHVLLYALKQIISNKIKFCTHTFVILVTNLLVTHHEENLIPWLDADTLGDTLSKLQKLNIMEVKQVIEQLRSKA